MQPNAVYHYNTCTYVHVPVPVLVLQTWISSAVQGEFTGQPTFHHDYAKSFPQGHAVFILDLWLMLYTSNKEEKHLYSRLEYLLLGCYSTLSIHTVHSVRGASHYSPLINKEPCWMQQYPCVDTTVMTKATTLLSVTRYN